VGEASALVALGIEVLGGEPGLEAGADGGPFGFGDGEPGGIPVLALDDHVVAEGAFVGEPEALGGAAGGRRWRRCRAIASGGSPAWSWRGRPGGGRLRW
jgi:hypothetical protein